MPYIFAATASAPFGLMPVEGVVPAPTNAYVVGTSAGAIQIGDVVVLGTDGRVQVAASGLISVAGTGVTTVIGVAAEGLDASPAAGTEILVYDNPDQIFVIQDDGNAAGGIQATGVGSIGLTFGFSATAGGTALNRSGMVLKGTSGSTAQTLPFKILGQHRVEGGGTGLITAGSGTFTRWRVKFNPASHLLQGGAI